MVGGMVEKSQKNPAETPESWIPRAYWGKAIL
jgi:hypothetical protein